MGRSNEKEMNRLFKHVSIYTIGNALNRGGAFILIPLYTRYLVPAEYGMLELFYALTTVFASFLSMGFAHATLRFYFEFDSFEDRKSVVSTSLVSSFLISASGVLLLSLGNSMIEQYVFDGKEIGYSLFFIYGIIVLEMISQVGFAYLRAREYSKSFVMASLVRLVVLVTFNLYIVIVLRRGVEGILMGNFISVFCETIIIGSIILKECGLGFQKDKFNMIVKYSYPFLFSSVFAVIVANFDRFYLKALYTFESVGLYALALKFGLAISVLLLEPFQRGYGAFRFSIIKKEDAKGIQAEVLTYMASGVVLAALGIAMFSNEILRLMGAFAYMEVSSLIPIIMLATSIGSLQYVFQTGILYQKRTEKIFFINTMSSVFGLSVTVGGIMYFGIYGAVFARLISSIFIVVLTYMVSQKIYPIPYPNKKIVLIMLNGIICYSTGSILAFLPDTIFIIVKILIIPLYVYGLFVLRILDKHDAIYLMSLNRLLKEKVIRMGKFA